MIDEIRDDPSQLVHVEWTRPKLKKFKQALSKAVKKTMSQEGVFEFEGHQFLIGYACYLVEFLERKLK